MKFGNEFTAVIYPKPRSKTGDRVYIILTLIAFAMFLTGFFA